MPGSAAPAENSYHDTLINPGDSPLITRFDEFEDSVLAAFLENGTLSVPARIEQKEKALQINYFRYFKIIIVCLGGIAALYLRGRYKSASS